MDVDSFMKDGLNDSESSGDNENNTGAGTSGSSKKKRKQKSGKKLLKDKSANPKDEVEPKKLESETAISTKEGIRTHRQGLKKLQDTDADFYKFLQENDAELLNFDDSSGDEDAAEDNLDEVDSDEEEQEEDGEGKRKGEDFIVESSGDEEDDDAAEGGEAKGAADSQDSRTKITRKLLVKWEAHIQKEPGRGVISNLVEAFRAAIERAGVDVHSEVYKVEDSKVFGDVLRICFTNLLDAWNKVLRLDAKPNQLFQQAKTREEKRKLARSKTNKRRGKYAPPLKAYLSDLLKFLPEIQDSGVLHAALKQLESLAPFISWFPRLTRHFIKGVANIWGRKVLSARKLAMSALLKLIDVKDNIIDDVIKHTYMSYVGNCKLVNYGTWPSIEYMQNSFAELCLIDADCAYRHAFLYIRQMAIHLRNAMIGKKKDMIQAVYNWQYIQSLYLWATVMTKSPQDSLLSQLTYPLIQIILGCSRLVPTVQFYPLRYHCIRAGLRIVQSRTPYIPVFTMISEILTNSLQFFNKRPPKFPQSKKRGKSGGGSVGLGKGKGTLSIENILRLKKGQLSDGHGKQAVIEGVEELIIECSMKYANSVAFPELVAPVVLSVKSFCKQSKTPEHSRLFRGLAGKLEEHAGFVLKRRHLSDIDLTDPEAMFWFSRKLTEAEDAPLRSYYKSWVGMKERTRQLRAAAQAKDEDEEEYLGPEGDGFSDDDNDEGEEEVEYDDGKEITREPSSKRKNKDGDSSATKAKKQRKSLTIDKSDPDYPAFTAEEMSVLKAKRKEISMPSMDGFNDVVQDFNLSDLEME